MRFGLLLLPLALAACFTEELLLDLQDRDDDEYIAVEAGGDDCDDRDSSIHPDAEEVCGDQVDNDCDGITDDAGVGDYTWYLDGDSDSYGRPDVSRDACEKPAGYVDRAGDCDDANGNANPGEVEVCGDDADNDCDGNTDDVGTGASNWYLDSDHDDFGDDDHVVYACEAPEHYVGIPGDCDDDDDDVNPAQEEVCDDDVDNDCDTHVDDVGIGASNWYLDDDDDGYGDDEVSVYACDPPEGYVGTPGDCDDEFDDTYPGADEVCDGRDNDCNDLEDDGAAPKSWYPDEDEDDYGDDDGVVESCDPPDVGWVDVGGDCDDDYDGTYPGADEVCDFRDNDCNDLEDDGVEPIEWYPDEDLDGFGDEDGGVVACEAPEVGWLEVGGDCDDEDEWTYPGIAVLDSTTECMTDADEDGWGDDSPAADVTEGTDCHDGDELTYPGAAPEDSSSECMTDDDGDGWGDSTPLTGVTEGTDCHDGDELTYPGAAPEDSTTACMTDFDGDGFGDDSPSVAGISIGDDCDDEDEDIHPDAEEIWYDGTDQDCDDGSDYDQDGDGFDAEAYSGSDCEDLVYEVNVEAEEVCDDGYDNDCDDTDNGCSLVGEWDIDEVADVTINGHNALFGNSVSTGDVDGDGNRDVVIGGYTDKVFLFLWPLAGTVSYTSADASIEYVTSGQPLTSVAAEGDVNGDGKNDILLGRHEEDEGGAAYLFYGPLSGDFSTDMANAMFETPDTDERQHDLGWSAALGDLDGDGKSDLVLGAHQPCVDASPSVYVFDGPIGAGSHERASADARIEYSSSAGFGVSVSAAGDVDGDAKDDLLVGADEIGSGQAYLFLGSVAGTLADSDADASFAGEKSRDQAGRTVEIIPDVSGDDLPDILIGATGFDSSRGAAYLAVGPFSGATGLGSVYARFLGDSAGDSAGGAVTGGDFNGDGLNDVVIASIYNLSHSGAVYVFYGPIGAGTHALEDADVVLRGGTDDTLGRSVRLVDLDDNGYDDIVVGGSQLAFIVLGHGN